MLVTAAGSSSKSINVLSATLEDTSRTSSLIVGGEMEVVASSLALAMGYYSDASTGMLLTLVTTSVEGPGGGDDGVGSGALSFSASTYSPIRLVNSPPKNV